MKAILLSALLLFSVNTHKYYFSHTTIRLNDITRSLEITMKIFTDDLEATIQDEGDPLRLGDELERDDADARIEDYIRQHFDLHLDNRPLNMVFIGKEVEHDITYCYFEVTQIPDFVILEVRHELLHRMFPDQLNRVELDINGRKKALDITKEQPKQVYNN